MTHVGMFEEARQASTIKKLKKRIVELMEIKQEPPTDPLKQEKKLIEVEDLYKDGM